MANSAQIKKFLQEKIQRTQRHPYLFIGSGFSYRYIQTERWNELLQYLCSLITDDKLRYTYYASKTSVTDYYGQQPQIAELLAKDFNEAVFTSDKFAEFRQRHFTELKANIPPIKIAIAEHLQKTLPFSIRDEMQEEFSLLKKLAIRSISGIITTNYDSLLETLFPNFKVFIGQENLLFSNLAGIGEIYKIHGSIEQPESIIITSSDYNHFEAHSVYLIAKILTIFIENPIIFIGYSINDKNIQNILQAIAKALSQDKLDILKERFIFINYANDDSITERTFRFENGNNISMTQISTKNFLPIYQAIYAVKSKYNPNILRNLRKDIYNMAIEHAPTGHIVATGFEKLEQLNPETQLILGIGVSQNGHIIKAEQLYEDVVLDNQFLNPSLVVEEYLPELLKRNSGGLPMFKYLQVYDKTIYGKVMMQINQHPNINSFLNDGLLRHKISYRKSLSNYTVDEIITKEGAEFAYKRLIYLEDNEIDLPAMQYYLAQILNKGPKKVLSNNSELKRLIRIYDFLKYKIAPTQSGQ